HLPPSEREPLIPAKIPHDFLSISHDCRLPPTAADCPRLPPTAPDCRRLPPTAADRRRAFAVAAAAATLPNLNLKITCWCFGFVSQY
ncbi:hypothetical protein LINPERHAP1_LOCUS1587, partial [Linum perenne]